MSWNLHDHNRTEKTLALIGIVMFILAIVIAAAVAVLT
jgi:hypothetical protein